MHGNGILERLSCRIEGDREQHTPHRAAADVCPVERPDDFSGGIELTPSVRLKASQENFRHGRFSSLACGLPLTPQGYQHQDEQQRDGDNDTHQSMHVGGEADLLIS